MTDKPDLFTEVLRRAEERRAELREAIERDEGTLKTCEASLGWLRRELATIEHIIEPLAGLEAQEGAEPVQPWCKPEQRRTRRDLAGLALAAVHDQPGLGSWEYADIVMADTGKRTNRERINMILEGFRDVGKIEWRDGWYPTGTDSVPNITEHPGREAATGYTLVQDYDECQRDVQALSEARTTPSVDSPAGPRTEEA